MSTFYNAQINNKDKVYGIQFETENYEWFKEVEKFCQGYVDKANEQREREKKIEAAWLKEFGQ